ncbi:MAG: winged helix-turn-helix domain-containing protein [Leucothrix sp.]
MPISLSKAHVRKLVLHSQRLPHSSAKGSALSATLAAIEHLSYIQIDTISVIQRAHHHTLWNRNPRYQLSHLDELLTQRQIFEYWSHAAAYLPMRDYRFSLFRKQAMASGEQNHWYPRNDTMMRYVLDRITAEGPLMAKDFDYQGKKIADWGSKPAKQALEYLFMQGDLMVPKRQNFHKVYDLTERVLPSNIDDKPPTPVEYARFLIQRFLLANGVGQLNEFVYLLKQIKPTVLTVLEEMLDHEALIQIEVKSGRTNTHYVALPEALSLLDRPLAKRKLKILSPFDNLLIQRKRMTDLFDFDYQIECYVPQQKRQYGYFVLPLLWLGRFVGRMDCKADRKTGVLHIHNISIEPWLKDKDGFLNSFMKTLEGFMDFNNCQMLLPNDLQKLF